MEPEQMNTLTLEQREQALRDREEALTRRERAEALRQGLSARGLPESLSPFLNGQGDRETEASLDALRNAWEEALSAAVQTRLRARPPASSGPLPPAPDEALRKIRAAMNLR